MFWLFLASVGIIASLWLRWRHKNRRLLAMASKLPGPPALPGFGNSLKFICKPGEFITVLKELMKEYGNIMGFWLGPDLNVIVSDPDAIKILLTSSKNSYKGPLYNYMVNVLGDGILTGSGSKWRRHRKIAAPNYGRRGLESYEPVFNKEVDLLIKKLSSIPVNIEFDVYRHIVNTTTYVVCQTLMGLNKEQTMNLPHLYEVVHESQKLYDIIFKRMTKWYLKIDPIFWVTNEYQFVNKFIAMVTEFSAKMVQHRREALKNFEQEYIEEDTNSEEEDNISNKMDFSIIDRFILSQEIEYDDILREIFTVFTSSQEASGKISSFVILMLAYHPDCQKKLYEEIKEVIGDVGRHITTEDLKKMPYLDMVFKEVIRMFPIGAIIQRTASEDIVLRRDYGAKLAKTVVLRIIQEFEVTSLNTYKDLQVNIAISAVSANGFKVMLKPRK
ncbi:cytochrome P450 4C1-like [Aphomia sociella]